jgi:ABC-type enterochelin transport system, permease component
LLAANFTYSVITSWRHAILLPAVILTGIIILLAGQLVLTYVLNMSGALSAVIEFCGGILFIILLLRRLKHD